MNVEKKKQYMSLLTNVQIIKTKEKKMRKQFFDCCRIIHLDIDILLDALKQEEDFKDKNGEDQS